MSIAISTCCKVSRIPIPFRTLDRSLYPRGPSPSIAGHPSPSREVNLRSSRHVVPHVQVVSNSVDFITSMRLVDACLHLMRRRSWSNILLVTALSLYGHIYKTRSPIVHGMLRFYVLRPCTLSDSPLQAHPCQTFPKRAHLDCSH